VNKVATIERMPDIVPADANSIMAIITRAATDPTVDIDKLERLGAMYERMKSREAEQAFNEAMTAVQTEMRPIAADANNPQTRSKYASYLALDRAMRPIYTKHGLSLSFNTADGAPEGYVRVVCDVAKGGYSKPYHVDMPADGKGAKGGDVMTKTHATGSAHTYGRRYLLKDIFNIAIGENDDDGNGGDDGGDERQQAQKSPEAQARERLLDAGRAAAMNGMAALNKWWASLNPRQQKEMGQDFGPMRKAARQADEQGSR